MGRVGISLPARGRRSLTLQLHCVAEGQSGRLGPKGVRCWVEVHGDGAAVGSGVGCCGVGGAAWQAGVGHLDPSAVRRHLHGLRNERGVGRGVGQPGGDVLHAIDENEERPRTKADPARTPGPACRPDAAEGGVGGAEAGRSEALRQQARRRAGGPVGAVRSDGGNEPQRREGGADACGRGEQGSNWAGKRAVARGAGGCGCWRLAGKPGRGVRARGPAAGLLTVSDASQRSADGSVGPWPDCQECGCRPRHAQTEGARSRAPEPQRVAVKACEPGRATSLHGRLGKIVDLFGSGLRRQVDVGGGVKTERAV